MFQVTQVPDARNEDNVYATENACASIAKILHYNASTVGDVQAVITQWIDTLPVANDEEAAPYAYAYLAELIDQYVYTMVRAGNNKTDHIHRGNPIVMGQASKLFVFIAQALEADTLRGQTASRVVAATKTMLSASNVDPTPLLQQFSQDSQRTIMAFFS